MKVFGWERCPRYNHYYKYVKYYSDKSLAAGIYSFRYIASVIYEAVVYINGNKIINQSKSLDDAKEWCDKMLDENGIKTLGEEYRILL